MDHVKSCWSNDGDGDANDDWRWRWRIWVSSFLLGRRQGELLPYYKYLIKRKQGPCCSVEEMIAADHHFACNSPLTIRPVRCNSDPCMVVWWMGKISSLTHSLTHSLQRNLIRRAEPSRAFFVFRKLEDFLACMIGDKRNETNIPMAEWN